jgi:LysR family hydrogen peroxide-inducible transcriptional activator
MSTITQLEYLLAVDRTRHFGQAAKECHVSQPSLSTQIQKLEDELGSILFDRSKKPILPTKVGVEVIKQAKVIIREHNKLHNIAHNQDIELSGHFKLGIIPTMAPYLIPFFIGSFSKNYPNVKLEIHEYQTDDIIKMLYNDRLDAAIAAVPLKDPALIERSLFFEPFHGYISESHRLNKKKLLKEADMDEDVWLLNEGHCFRNQVIKVCALDQKRNTFENISFESGNLETLVHLIKKNSGYTLLPYLATLFLSEAEKKKYIRNFQKPVPTREVGLIHSRSFLGEAIIEALEKEIVKNIPKCLKSLKSKEIQVIDF